MTTETALAPTRRSEATQRTAGLRPREPRSTPTPKHPFSPLRAAPHCTLFLVWKTWFEMLSSTPSPSAPSAVADQPLGPATRAHTWPAQRGVCSLTRSSRPPSRCVCVTVLLPYRVDFPKMHMSSLTRNPTVSAACSGTVYGVSCAVATEHR